MLVECDHCEAIVDGESLASYVVDDDETWDVGRYTFLKCPRCSRPFVMVEVYNGFDENEWDEPTRLYPQLRLGTSLAIPNALRLSYEEARACFRAKAYIATAIMCRKTLEGIAEEHKITARNLDVALKKMREEGIIETRLYEWADALRISGNEAAHGVEAKITAQDAKDILEFTQALLEYVFTFQEKFRQFQNRRNPEDTVPF